jgi:K+-sensing histidine kinase KdpD
MTPTVSIPGRIGAAIAPILVAALLVPFRESLDRATMVLVLVLVVVAVATTGDRVAAVIAAVIAAASFDFFLTRPYTSMRITSAADLETAAMLLVIGLAVGQLAISGQRRRSDADRARDELHRMELVAERIAKQPEILGLVEMVEGQILQVLDLESCSFSSDRPPLPELRPDGTIDSATKRLADGEFVMPEDGAALLVENGGVTLGWLQLVPGRRVGVSLETRKVAIALAQQLGAALARSRDWGSGTPSA